MGQDNKYEMGLVWIMEHELKKKIVRVLCINYVGTM